MNLLTRYPLLSIEYYRRRKVIRLVAINMNFKSIVVKTLISVVLREGVTKSKQENLGHLTSFFISDTSVYIILRGGQEIMNFFHNFGTF